MACAFLSYGPSLGFPLVMALRLLYEGKPFCWLTFEIYNDDKHYVEWVFPTPGPFPVLALRLQYGNMAYRWLITSIIWATLLFFISPRLRGGLPSTIVASYPSRLCRWWTVQGSLLSPLHFFAFSLEYHGVRRPALGPALPYRGGLLRSAVLSWALLSRFLPSRVSPFNTRRSALWLARCSKVPVIGSFFGSRLDSRFRPLTVPFMGPVPSCCWCFTLRCLFSLALQYWLTLLLHTPSFHTNFYFAAQLALYAASCGFVHYKSPTVPTIVD